MPLPSGSVAWNAMRPCSFIRSELSSMFWMFTPTGCPGAGRLVCSAAIMPPLGLPNQITRSTDGPLIRPITAARAPLANTPRFSARIEYAGSNPGGSAEFQSNGLGVGTEPAKTPVSTVVLTPVSQIVGLKPISPVDVTTRLLKPVRLAEPGSQINPGSVETGSRSRAISRNLSSAPPTRMWSFPLEMPGPAIDAAKSTCPALLIDPPDAPAMV